MTYPLHRTRSLDPCTLNMERIIIVVMIFVAVCANIEPDFSCDFDGGDDCNITNLEGMWISQRGDLRAIWTPNRTDDLRTFSIPYRFMSPSGNLSFTYSITVSGNLVVTTCRDQNDPILDVSSSGSISQSDSVQLSYLCPNVNDVEIQFIVKRGSISPTFTVDDILIYELPYSVEGTEEPFSTSIFTTSSSPRVYDDYTTSSPNTQTAKPTFGTITASVISSVITAFVTCCLFLGIVLCRRFLRSKKNASGSNPKPTAATNHPALALDNEVQHDSIQLHELSDQPTPVSTPMQGETSDYMGLINPDTPHVYGHATHGQPLVMHYKDRNEGARLDADGYDYEVPFTHSESDAEGDQTNALNYDDVIVKAPKQYQNF